VAREIELCPNRLKRVERNVFADIFICAFGQDNFVEADTFIMVLGVENERGSGPPYS